MASNEKRHMNDAIKLFLIYFKEIEMFKKIQFNRYALSLVLCSFAMPTLAALHVYGPGGPAPAMQEAAKQFQNQTGIEVKVTAGPTKQWVDQAKVDADIFYSGSEAMMSDLEITFLDQIVKLSVEPLYLRPAAILVRDGNPKHIKGFKDLANSNIKVLVTHGAGQVGMWEDIVGRTGTIQLTKDFRKNIALYAQNTGLAKKAWEEDKSYDAWLVFNIWGVNNPNIGQIVPIERDLVIYRDMGVALTERGEKNLETQKFIDFLKSSEGLVIFKKFGWSK